MSAAEKGFGGEVARRLVTGEWTARAFACDEALAPIAEYLRDTFQMEIHGTVVIVIRCREVDDANAQQARLHAQIAALRAGGDTRG